MVKTSENDLQTLQHTCIGTFNNPLGPFRNLSSHIVFYPLPPFLGINFLLGGGIRVLWKHFFQLFNFRRHAIRLSCLSFKTAKCWIQTSPLNRLYKPKMHDHRNGHGMDSGMWSSFSALFESNATMSMEQKEEIKKKSG